MTRRIGSEFSFRRTISIDLPVQIILDVSRIEGSTSGKFTATIVTTHSGCGRIEPLDSCLIVLWRKMSVPRSHRNCLVPS